MFLESSANLVYSVFDTLNSLSGKRVGGLMHARSLDKVSGMAPGSREGYNLQLCIYNLRDVSRLI